MLHKPLILALLAGLTVSGAAQAELYDRGGGLIYDDVLNITWLKDANYAKTSGYDADGLMNWDNAVAWADALVYHDSVRNVDYSEWRLPTALNQDGTGPCVGENCTDSEMGHLFYVDLGGTGGQSILTSGDADLAKFTNLQSSQSNGYWTGTVYSSAPANAWHFVTQSGGMYTSAKYNEDYAWAVHPGDVAAVPEADTWAMLLAGLGLVGMAARRRGGFGASGASTLSGVQGTLAPCGFEVFVGIFDT